MEVKILDVVYVNDMDDDEFYRIHDNISDECWATRDDNLCISSTNLSEKEPVLFAAIKESLGDSCPEVFDVIIEL